MTIKSRRKGAKAELELVQRLQDAGFAAEKISRMYKRGPDLSVPLLGVDHSVEVKVRARGFQQLYGWLTGADLLVVRADRSEPLVVIPFSLAISIARAAENLRVMRDGAPDAPSPGNTGPKEGPRS
jgi:Holliday junction resolvase